MLTRAMSRKVWASMVEEMRWRRLYAHRGASASHRENSLDAFAEAIRLGVDGIELDIRGTSDGVPVVIHDTGLGRTQGQDRRVADLTMAELRELAPSVPTLAEVVALVGPGCCHLDIEIKETGLESRVLEQLAGLPYDRWAISSFTWDVLGTIRAMDPAADVWVLGFSASLDALDAVDRLDATTIAIAHGAITPDIVTMLKSAGRRVMAWTVNDLRRAWDLAVWGVDAICTDDPAAMLSAAPAT